jgi:hypothetical protein
MAGIMRAFAILLIVILAATSWSSLGDSWTASPPAENTDVLALPDSGLLPFGITGREPVEVAVGDQVIPFEQYISFNRSHEIWVRNGNVWVQAISVRQADRAEMIAFTPSGGHADLYLIPYGSGTISHRGYDLLPGYYRLNLSLPETGRIMMILAVKGQPANALIIDVLPAEAATQNGPADVTSFSAAKARVTIESENVKGYDVYVDGSFYASDLMDGNSDGIASFEVSGGRDHVITIIKKGEMDSPDYQSEHRRSFEGGYSYTLHT